MNCTTPPLMTVRQCYDFGSRAGRRHPDLHGLDRVGLVAGGGVSHFVGEPRVGDIDEEFDHWFLEELGKPRPRRAARPAQRRADGGRQRHRRGPGLGRDRRRDAGSKPGTVLSYEPIYEWINGMAVVSYAA